MKKLLSILGSLGMIASPTQILVSCTTDDFSLPTNPSNGDEVIELIKYYKEIFEQYEEIAESLTDEENAFFTTSEPTQEQVKKIKESANIQNLVILTCKFYVIEAKVIQFAISLTTNGLEEFLEKLSQEASISAEEAEYWEDICEDASQDIIDEIMLYVNGLSDFSSSSTINKINKLISWSEDNKFNNN